MLKYDLSANKKIVVNSSEDNDFCYELVADESCNSIIEIVGTKGINLNLSCHVKENVVLRLLIVNSNQGKLLINDKYVMDGNSDSVIAYCQFSNSDVITTSKYQLINPLANLRVLSASISENKKTFNQTVEHLADHTSANVDNYGIVLKDGDVKMVVKNIIGKDQKFCQTKQSNRILTYDSTSKAKVLPILCIDDNEVEAAHGCSMGQPDENQIYYLMSRGLTRKQALDLITIGYLMPITNICDDESINEAIKNEIISKVNTNA